MESQVAYKLLFTEYPDVVNVEQMCEMLGGICDKTAYRLLKSGEIKSFIVGRHYRIPKLNILEYLELIDVAVTGVQTCALPILLGIDR